MINAYVLVLNKSWVAVNVASAKRALVLLFQGHARVVHPKDYALYDFDAWLEFSRASNGVSPRRYVYTPSERIRLREVIVLNGFNGFHRPEVRLSRRNIFARDKSVCQYCGIRYSRSELSIDHVIPKSRDDGSRGRRRTLRGKADLPRCSAPRTTDLNRQTGQGHRQKPEGVGLWRITK